MKIKFLIPGFILILIFHHFTFAQKFDLKFNLVDGPDGKPLGKVNSITQDPHGYIWLCGSGERCIYRYDGNKMIPFRHNDTNPNSLGLNTLETIYADEKGLIWIGGEGLDQYNPETRIFTHYNLMQNDTGIPDGNYVYSILKDDLGRLWVGTGNGLKQLDEKTGKFISYRHEPGNPKSLSSNVIWRLYKDHAGVVWKATGFPFFNRNPEDGGLNRLNVDGTFTSFMHDLKDPTSLSNNKVAAMYEDKQGTFWVGTGGDGLHIMDRKTGHFERHPYNPIHPDILSKPLLHSKESNDKITFISGDNSGALWIGTMYSGINRYDAITKKSTHFENSNGFPDATSWNTFTSKEGTLWIATQSDILLWVDPFQTTDDLVGWEGLPDSNRDGEEGTTFVIQLPV